MDDGGPAFPRPQSTDEHVHQCNLAPAQDGMSLRDWFASQVIAAVYAEAINGIGSDASRAAYRIADDMLLARQATRTRGGDS